MSTQKSHGLGCYNRIKLSLLLLLYDRVSLCCIYGLDFSNQINQCRSPIRVCFESTKCRHNVVTPIWKCQFSPPENNATIESAAWIVAIIGEWGYHNTWIHRSEGWTDDTTVPHIHDVTTRVRCHLPPKISRACGFLSPCVNQKHACLGGESFLNGWLPQESGLQVFDDKNMDFPKASRAP